MNKHKSNKIKENSNTVRHLNNGTDHRHSKSCCDQSSPARRTINIGSYFILPLSMWRHRVTWLPPKNASAPWGGAGSRWLIIIIWQVSYIQYLLACQKSQRSTPYNIVKSGLPWKRVLRRRDLGRLRWPTVLIKLWYKWCTNKQYLWLQFLPPSTRDVSN